MFAAAIARCVDIGISVDDAVVPGEDWIPRTARAITDFDDHPVKHNIVSWILILVVDQVVARVWRAIDDDVRS